MAAWPGAGTGEEKVAGTQAACLVSPSVHPARAQQGMKCSLAVSDTLYPSVAVLGKLLDSHIFSDT